MTGWTVINLLKNREYEPEEDEDILYYFDNKVQQAVKERVEQADFAWHNNVYLVQIGGYRDWEEDEEIIEAIAKYWDKAVILHANDTGDTGHAKYYEKSESSDIHETGEVLQLDEFEEQELIHGRPVGAKAISYMSLMHDVHGHNSLSRPRTHSIEHYPSRNQEAWKELRQAYSRFNIGHLGDDVIIENLEKALKHMKGKEVEDE